MQDFGQSPDGRVQLIELAGPGGATAEVLTWGAVVRDLCVPRADGRLQPVMLGFTGLAPYLDNAAHVGVLAGRVANRISGGRFTLDGQTFTLDRNEGGRATLHGGAGGFAHRLWRVAERAADAVTLEFVSPDGDQGFPGRLTARCRYALEAGTSGPVLSVDLHAVCDRPCPVNMTQHAYFNLDGSADVSGHALWIDADRFVPTDAGLIPTGGLASVEGTAFDFRRARRLDATPPLDLCYAVAGDIRRAVARLESPASGLALEVATTKPGLQVYDAGKLDVTDPGSGRRFGPRAGICLETQFFPDSPNRPEFPDITLRPGAAYSHRTEFRFSAQ